jgi:DNA-binding transcriptional MerR regulator
VSQEDLDQQVDDAVSTELPGMGSGVHAKPPTETLPAASVSASPRTRARALNRAATVEPGRQEARVGMPTAMPVVALPPIPAKRYFTIGEVSELCGVKPYVLRYWEQEFQQLRPMKRRGNRRYYQHHEVLLVRRIRELLYEQGFTISGARNQLLDNAMPGPAGGAQPAAMVGAAVAGGVVGLTRHGSEASGRPSAAMAAEPALPWPGVDMSQWAAQHPGAVEALRAELLVIRDILA